MFLKVESDQISRTKLIVLLSLVWFIFPVLSIVFILGSIGLIDFTKNQRSYLIFIISSVMGLISYTKVPVADLEVYYSFYERLYHLPLGEFYKVYGIDPLFYFITSVLSKLTFGIPPFFSLFWVTLIYYFLLKSIELISIKLNISKILMCFIMLHMVYLGYNFGMAGHIVRQYVAYSLLFYSVALLISGEIKKSTFVYFCTLFVHISAILFFPLFYILKRNEVIQKNKFLIVLTIVIPICVLLSRQDLLSFLQYMPDFSITALKIIKSKAANYDYVFAGQVPLSFYIESCLLFAASLFSFIFSKEHKQSESILFYFILFPFLILLAFASTDIVFFRYVFYLHGLSALMIIYILKKTKLKVFVIFIVMFGIIAPLRFIRKISSNPPEYEYIENSLSIFLVPVIEFFM